MAEAVGAVLVLVTASLTRAVRRGAVAARAALSEPRAGTILSVIHAFAEALQHDHGHRHTGSWTQHALPGPLQALADTTTQPAVLQQSGVGDPRAQGFVTLVAGVGEFLVPARGGNNLSH